VFQVRPTPGLFDVLEKRAELRHAICPVTAGNLHVLPLGRGTASLASLLSSASGAALMSALREQFRYVIVDAGMIRRDPGGMLLASLADGVVVAAGVAARRRDEITTFHQELRLLNLPLFGIVLTWVA
jgi:Mrp family chromosome partitioning ATPase